MDILIRNGLIVDGTGSNAYEADIAISEGRIVDIGKNLSYKAGEVIDAEGLAVSPGFIDVHSHNDLVPFMDRQIGNLKLLQGVTLQSEMGKHIRRTTEEWLSIRRYLIKSISLLCWHKLMLFIFLN